MEQDSGVCWTGFKIVGDNLDLNVRPRYRRIDKETVSLHFFHYFAVKDCVDLCHIPDELNSYVAVPTHELPINTLLPTACDHQTLVHHFGLLISRVLVEELPYFKSTFSDVVVKHIDHMHYNQMSETSETVSYMYM